MTRKRTEIKDLTKKFHKPKHLNDISCGASNGFTSRFYNPHVAVVYYRSLTRHAIPLRNSAIIDSFPWFLDSKLYLSTRQIPKT
jgi:hypothetical protein